MPTMDLVPYDSGIQFGTRYLTKEAAFFLGGIFSSAEYVKAGTDLYWIAPVRYNYGYATDLEIEEHFEDIKVMSSAMGAQTIMADNVRGTFLDSGKFRLPGFGTFFKGNNLPDLHSAIPDLRNALDLSPWDVKRAFIAGVFDGRGSIDINKKNHTIRYIVLDCPTDEIGSFLYDFMKNNGFPCNYNTARDRLEGGEPRKPQLRIKNDEDYRLNRTNNIYIILKQEVSWIIYSFSLPFLRKPLARWSPNNQIHFPFVFSKSRINRKLCYIINDHFCIRPIFSIGCSNRCIIFICKNNLKAAVLES